MIKNILKVGHHQGHLARLHLNLHHYIITNACLSIHRNIYIMKTMSKKNTISIFPKTKKNLHPEGMPNLSKFSRDPMVIAQNINVSRKGFRTKKL